MKEKKRGRCSESMDCWFLTSGLELGGDSDWGGCWDGGMKKGRRRPALNLFRDFDAHRRHQFLEAHQVQHPFEVISQGHQVPFAPDFLQSFHQKIAVAQTTA